MLVSTKWPKKGAVYIIMLFSAAIQMGCDTHSDAPRLVQAMQLDRAVLLSYVLPIMRGHTSGQLKLQADSPEMKLYMCLVSLPKLTFSAIIADRLTQKLSSEEIKRATVFFESPAGAKYIKREVLALPEFLQLTQGPTAAQVSLSAEDSAAITEFSQTPEGGKVMLENILDDEPTQQLLLAKWQATLQECREKITEN